MPKKGYKQTREHTEKIRQNSLEQFKHGMPKKTKNTIKKVLANPTIKIKMSGKNNGMYQQGHKISREKNYKWKGTKYQDKFNRWIIWINNTKYAQARYITEKCLDRKLKSKEIVHHINEDPSDDRPENLYLFATTGEHLSWHNSKIKICLISNII